MYVLNYTLPFEVVKNCEMIELIAKVEVSADIDEFPIIIYKVEIKSREETLLEIPIISYGDSCTVTEKERSERKVHLQFAMGVGNYIQNQINLWPSGPTIIKKVKSDIDSINIHLEDDWFVE
ncbi:hypothetical protein H70357_31420 [Paenibacillus sp. FSL H7-0357]|uniref:hypothetical protein n=1 Tax=Paenibacillus sp. FSL H7-0357 TaxID=1536774 RepID=UPI0004F6EA85|nr:hypothetical protein [Paenibacillus sp. FSL H7-0357]AIQ20692.1 hypothetical protein H70357_31420 [Paenibacillus sp. FSL H7-0357]